MGVRELTVDDWAGLWPLVKGFGTEFSEPESRGYFEELVEDPRWVALGYDDGGELIGYAAVQDYGTHLRAGRRHHGRLHDLYVLPDRRRGGVGRALMAAVAEWASTRVRHLEWQGHHERAAPFYEALGYHGDPCPQPDYPTFEIDFGK
ncbi:GNAT family N-acetyltransferase [Kribbella jiaozuonensis]|uniref:GNAT family N-acetyltransferase n=1 Tax=Kribbella jiaozuonensis TaxID=2575441 RepID=A0A4U3LQL4_9ACTN|nr:GNAT family N-acetyltransferase [Kribbella jiaozuonensis]TKK78000.1 GNAT family N-acetyltransferase [Kribbella jiaozuonensis]